MWRKFLLFQVIIAVLLGIILECKAQAHSVDLEATTFMKNLDKSLHFNWETFGNLKPSQAPIVEFDLCGGAILVRKPTVAQSSGNIQYDLTCMEALYCLLAPNLQLSRAEMLESDKPRRMKITFLPVDKMSPWHCADRYFKNNPDIKNKLVLHAIPLSTPAKYAESVTYGEVHSEPNLCVIANSPDAIKRYTDAMEIWQRFFSTHPKASREDVLKTREEFREFLSK